MTRPLFYSSDVTGKAPGDAVYLDAATSAHAIRSQRLGLGDLLMVSDGAGTLAHGTITSADPQSAGIIVETVEVQPSPAVRINLVQALAKGDRDLMAVEMATEVGVDAITPWQAQRSIVRMRPERAAKMRAKWEAKLHAAAQQSRRAFIPALRPAVEGTGISELHAPGDNQHLVVLHEDARSTMQEVVEALPKTLADLHLVVGPEGGVSPEELAAVEQAGGNTVQLGSTVMRASTAGPVAIALLNHFLDRW
ncbi:16S rRNA (uracil(1498)-N(3))-methyltransferase [Enteractinococcus fodinae]|uniref:Ribosomal RNA small subunit methyltransferase E n=1 Tax=Enteractinococcus fodinae TaxID=684663 RepID=A0ABU2B1A6_9MICC|nr:16S rRNA (uracil(1498)-N(3))-methyltransferase [Enteractinococcus fodinae]MDR7347201.1 16S rRNA (uracil1498-N3)-methyltransferase [Enteractinococcus fodinae]